MLGRHYCCRCTVHMDKEGSFCKDFLSARSLAGSGYPGAPPPTPEGPRATVRYGAGFTKSGTKRRNASDRRMRASLALTVLAMEPSSRRVLLTLSGVKTPQDS